MFCFNSHNVTLMSLLWQTVLDQNTRAFTKHWYMNQGEKYVKRVQILG